jgi:hypothetical protein
LRGTVGGGRTLGSAAPHGATLPKVRRASRVLWANSSDPPGSVTSSGIPPELSATVHVQVQPSLRNGFTASA